MMCLGGDNEMLYKGTYQSSLDTQLKENGWIWNQIGQNTTDPV